MKIDYCLNLCELLKHIGARNITLADVIRQTEQKLVIGHIGRIYIGSYFCSHYFLHLSNQDLEEAINYAQGHDMKVTLVLPMFTENNLTIGKERLEALRLYYGTVIDEITVNDFGMLEYIKKTCPVNINIGRLMNKEYRDPRYSEYFKNPLVPRIFTSHMKELMNTYKITSIEFDPTHEIIDFSNKPENIMIGLHSPYCYITTGQICEYSSINEEIAKKFRPNIECKIECISHHIEYELEEEAGGRKFIRFGRTIYFENSLCQVKGLDKMRVIYFPIDLYVG